MRFTTPSVNINALCCVTSYTLMSSYYNVFFSKLYISYVRNLLCAQKRFQFNNTKYLSIYGIKTASNASQLL